MGIISVKQADSLLWLGRYTERVYTTIKMFNQSFDRMIDEEEDSYPDFCTKLDIPNIYKDKEDFMYRYPYDLTNPDSIMSTLNRAYDNAIELRETIGSETLAYIQLAIYDWNKASRNQAPLLETQKVIDHIMAFWGIADDIIDNPEVRNILKAGKRIERIDLYARMHFSPYQLKREIRRMIPRVEASGLKYDPEKLEKIRALVYMPEVDYYQLVEEVETIF
ncbi:MAG: alpha-E domain-containing protein [Lachnospiraceae bacterium]|nr:alpha-E domain-containing protein [Lachnospiraceae bacterium]